ncbi:MAG: DUF1573 domain-containing protein [Planctomycetota bacterium]|jgi:hypothetical protein|nr:DUF1573 domain-containing protein [Planctomycetota bacterium]
MSIYTMGMNAKYSFIPALALRLGGVLGLVLLPASCGDDATTPPAVGSTNTTNQSPASKATTPSSPPSQASASGSEDMLVPGGYLKISPSLLDFGAVGPGTIHPTTFRISNIGTQDVVVESVTPSCVCTTLTDLNGVTIPAGATIEMAASLDAPRQPGEKEAKVFLRIVGVEGVAMVKIKGMVTLPIQPTPTYADALKGVTGGVIDLSSQDGRPFSVVASNGSPPVFEGFDPATDQPRNSYRVKWSIAGLAGPSIPRWWIFTTDRDDCPLVPCRLRNENTGARRDMERMTRHWIIDEDFLDLGSVQIGQPIDLTCVIKHYNPRGGGAVEQSNWWQVLGVGSASTESLRAEFKGVVRLSDEEAEVRIQMTPTGPPSDLMVGYIGIRTSTGNGLLEVAAKVVR